jgi:AcrR family transcriptional regulator
VEAGVTLGLVQHHFKTKAGLRDAVDQLVVDYFSSTLAEVGRRESTQIVAVLVRQMGELLLQPMVDAIWDRVAKPGEGTKPRLHVFVE